MGAFSLSHILVIALLAVVLFGRGRIAGLMGELGKGVRGFRKSMADDDAVQAPGVENRPAPAIAATAPARDA